MGGHSSKTREQDPYADMASEVRSFEAACEDDPLLLSFNSTLQQSTSRAINTVARGARDQSLSLESVGELNGCFAKTSQLVAEHILIYKEDILKNNDMFELVKDYFDNSLLILQVCEDLKKCINHVKSMLQEALQKIEEEQREPGFDGKCSNALKVLDNFKTAGNPFTKELSSKLESVCEKEKSMLEKLRTKKSKLDKKLKKIKAWRTVSNVIIGGAIVSVLICSILAAAVVAQPVVVALGAAVMETVVPMGVWIDTLWRKYVNVVQAHSEILSSLELSIHDWKINLDNIVPDVNKLKNEFASLLGNVEYPLREEAAVMLTMKAIKKKLSGLMETIEKVSEHTDECKRDVLSGRRQISEKIVTCGHNARK